MSDKAEFWKRLHGELDAMEKSVDELSASASESDREQLRAHHGEFKSAVKEGHGSDDEAKRERASKAHQKLNELLGGLRDR